MSVSVKVQRYCADGMHHWERYETPVEAAAHIETCPAHADAQGLEQLAMLKSIGGALVATISAAQETSARDDLQGRTECRALLDKARTLMLEQSAVLAELARGER